MRRVDAEKDEAESVSAAGQTKPSGTNTLATKCTTPLVASLSSVPAWPVISVEGMLLVVKLSDIVGTISGRAVDATSPEWTWYRRTSRRRAELPSACRHFRVSSSTAANAASVGAKTVNGPVPPRVVARLAVVSKSSKIAWDALSEMMSKTVLFGGVQVKPAGTSTVSIECTIPVLVHMSVPPAIAEMSATVMLFPVNVVARVLIPVVVKPGNCEARMMPPWTWYLSSSPSRSTLSGCNRQARVAASTFWNASLVGAKTVYTPAGAARTVSRLAATTRSSSVWWSGLATTTSVMVREAIGGRRTLSMACTTPLGVFRSATTTFAEMSLPAIVPPSTLLTVSSGTGVPAARVGKAAAAAGRLAASTAASFSARTWFRRIWLTRGAQSLFVAGSVNFVSIAAGMSVLIAWSVGANTVKYPEAGVPVTAVERVCAKPATATRLSSLL
mmetsp:Transcript_24913/g.59196  ORF Transcript_24913/g.59196 Transcript_24913/m.59196 type:complete len:444 (+) Transcript_24913:123-1454(+)